MIIHAGSAIEEAKLRLFLTGVGKEFWDAQGLQRQHPRATPRHARITQKHNNVYKSRAIARDSRFAAGVIRFDIGHEKNEQLNSLLFQSAADTGS